MNQLTVILPKGTKVTRITKVKMTETPKACGENTSELRTDFVIHNDNGERVAVNHNLTFAIGNRAFYQMKEVSCFHPNKYDVVLKKDVEYSNEYIPAARLAYDTPVVLAPGTEVIIPAETKLFIDFEPFIEVTINQNVTVKLL